MKSLPSEVLKQLLKKKRLNERKILHFLNIQNPMQRFATGNILYNAFRQNWRQVLQPWVVSSSTKSLACSAVITSMWLTWKKKKVQWEKLNNADDIVLCPDGEDSAVSSTSLAFQVFRSRLREWRAADACDGGCYPISAKNFFCPVITAGLLFQN